MRLWSLLASNALYLAVYTAAFQMMAYFPASPTGLALGPNGVGAVFSAYPLAAALAAPLPPLSISCIGLRTTALIGVCLASLSVFMFGLLPLAPGPGLLVALILVRGLGGVGSTMVETSCLTSISTSGWGDDLGKAFATLEVMTGSGYAFGAMIGGQLYDAGARSPVGAFLTPCAFCAALLLFMLPAAMVLPSKHVIGTRQGAGGTAGDVLDLRRLLTPRRAATALSLALAATVVESINPLLEVHLLRVPYSFTPRKVGLVFGAICVAYMLCSLAVGAAVDKLSRDPVLMARRLKCLMAAGWIFTIAGLLLLGPAAASAEAHLLAHAELPEAIMWGGAVVLGAAAATIIIPTLCVCDHWHARPAPRSGRQAQESHFIYRLPGHIHASIFLRSGRTRTMTPFRIWLH
jgi:MFS family permease